MTDDPVTTLDAQDPPEDVPRWDAATETCWHSCGSLSWTRERYGRLTHKHACPLRADPFCQSHESCKEIPHG